MARRSSAPQGSEVALRSARCPQRGRRAAVRTGETVLMRRLAERDRLQPESSGSCSASSRFPT